MQAFARRREGAGGRPWVLRSRRFCVGVKELGRVVERATPKQSGLHCAMALMLCSARFDVDDLVALDHLLQAW
jgi:hypothetical protein